MLINITSFLYYLKMGRAHIQRIVFPVIWMGREVMERDWKGATTSSPRTSGKGNVMAYVLFPEACKGWAGAGPTLGTSWVTKELELIELWNNSLFLNYFRMWYRMTCVKCWELSQGSRPVLLKFKNVVKRLVVVKPPRKSHKIPRHTIFEFLSGTAKPGPQV